MIRSLCNLAAGPALIALAACAPQVPGSEAPDYVGSPRVIDAQLDGSQPQATDQPLPLPAAIAAQPLPPGAAAATAPNADIAADTAAALAATGAGAAQPGTGTETDAERLARYRAQHQPVAPAALPGQASGAAPNVVAYALSSDNPRGTRVYSRSGVNLASGAAANCARFASSDQAQAAFLADGGPQKDGGNLDPDGDGYACGWDPAPFRRAVQN